MKIAAILLLGCLSFFFGYSTTRSVNKAKPEIINDEHGRELLVGKWLGQIKLKGGGTRQWLNHRSADGTYVVTFRTVVGGAAEITQEYGSWGYSGGVYFTKMLGWIRDGKREPVRDPDAYFDDTYRVLELNAETFRYQSLATGSIYEVKRAPDDFLIEKSSATLAPTPEDENVPIALQSITFVIEGVAPEDGVSRSEADVLAKFYRDNALRNGDLLFESEDAASFRYSYKTHYKIIVLKSGERVFLKGAGEFVYSGHSLWTWRVPQ